jgi:hypothetical protein
VRPSRSTIWFDSGTTRSAPTASKPMAFFARCVGASTWMSAGLRQPTATQGFEGVKLNFVPSPMTLMAAFSLPSAALNS